MQFSKIFSIIAVTMVAGAIAGPTVGQGQQTAEEIAALKARKVEDPDCCGTGYSEDDCSAGTNGCDGAAACCPVVPNGTSCYGCTAACGSQNGEKAGCTGSWTSSTRRMFA